MMAATLVVATMLNVARCGAFSVSYARRSKTRVYSSAQVAVDRCISRLPTLQTMLMEYGAPGSRDCHSPSDLTPVEIGPELLESMAGSDRSDLHPFLFPIARSQSSQGNYICAYRHPSTETQKVPWPIVESKVGAPGMLLLALNSEHLMRRIACECDASGARVDLVDLYNKGLGEGAMSDPALDSPYREGEVEKLGYGVDKYVLLRVGPFADLYAQMAKQHAKKGDEQSSLIAAEACNGKFSGFGSTYAFYARLLDSFPNRREEARDAARMCLRLPLATAGMTYGDLKEVAILAQVATESDSVEEALLSLKSMYNKIQEVEKEEDPNQGKTPEQIVLDEMNRLLDHAVLESQPWSNVRPSVAAKLREAGLGDFATFVDSTSR